MPIAKKKKIKLKLPIFKVGRKITDPAGSGFNVEVIASTKEILVFERIDYSLIRIKSTDVNHLELRRLQSQH